MTSRDARLRAIRIATAFWLVGWYLKIPYFLNTQILENFSFPIVEHPLLPGLFLHPASAIVALVLPVIAIAVFFCQHRRILVGIAIAMALCSLIRLLHVSGYNDATYVTSLWAAAWIGWVANQLDAKHDIRAQACLLAQAIVGLCFLGGAVGKYTAEYWNGDVFYYLYFEERPLLIYRWMRENLDVPSQRFFAMLFSRIVVVSETVLGFGIFMPLKFHAVLSISTLVGMGLISTYNLYSVLACLIGLLVAAITWPTTATPATLTTTHP